MAGLFDWTSAVRMDLGMGWSLGHTILDASRDDEPLPAWKFVSVSTVNRGSAIPGAGNSFE
jgi:hypothetical protein